MMNARLILEKMAVLNGLINPDWVDGNSGNPRPLFSEAINGLMIGSVLKQIGATIQDKELGKQLHQLGKQMAVGAAQGLVAGWDADDDLGPPWRWPWPRRAGTETTARFDPEPAPWRSDPEPDP